MASVFAAVVMLSEIRAEPAAGSHVLGAPECSDFHDNDGDGRTDATDPDCIGGDESPGDPIGGGTDAACAAAGLLPGGDLADGIQDIACRLSTADLKFVTVFDDGEVAVTRVHQATFVTPTPLDADADPAPDLIATVELAPQHVALDIDRAPTESGRLPVRVELVIADPTGGDLPRERLFLGYDAREDTAPRQFRATTPVSILDEVLGGGDSDAPAVELTHATVSPGERLAVVGGLFDGEAHPESRRNPIQGALEYSPVPAQGSITLEVESDDYRIALGRSAEVTPRLDASFEHRHEDDSTTGRAFIADLPRDLELSYQNDGGLRTARYDASEAAWDLLRAHYENVVNGVVVDKARARAIDLPGRLTVTQQGLGPRSARITAEEGSLGIVQVGYASQARGPLFLPRTKPYGYVVSEPGLESYAVRLKDLQSALFRAEREQPIELDAQFSDVQLAFRVRARMGRTSNLPPLDVEGLINRPPQHVFTRIEPRSGKVEYNGFGQGIGLVHADIKGRPFFDNVLGGTVRQPIFGRVRHIAATATGLPSKITTTVRSGTDGFEGFDFRTHETGSLDLVELMLTDAPEEDPSGWRNAGGLSGVLDGSSGAIFEDVEDDFTAFGRLRRLRSANVSTLQRVRAKRGTAIRRNIDVDASLTGPRQPLVAEVQRSARDGLPAFDATAHLNDLPSRVHLNISPARGTTSYDGFGDAIRMVHVDIQALEPLFDRVRHIVGQIEDLPPRVDTTVGSGPSGFEGLDFKADPSLGIAALMMTNSRPGADPPAWSDPGGLSTILAEEGNPISGGLLTARAGDSPRNFRAFGRLQDVQQLSFAPDPVSATLKTADPQFVFFDATYDEVGDEQSAGTAQVRIDELPTSLSVKSPTGGIEGIEYTASDLIDRLEGVATNLPGSPREFEPHNLTFTVRDLPQFLGLYGGCEDGEPDDLGRCPGGGANEVLGLDTRELGAVGEITARAWDVPESAPRTPPSDQNFVEAQSVPARGKTFSASAHIEDLDRFLLVQQPGSKFISSRFGTANPLPTHFNVRTGGRFNPDTSLIDTLLRLSGQLPEPPRAIKATAHEGGLVEFAPSDEISEALIGIGLNPEHLPGGFVRAIEDTAIALHLREIGPLDFCASGERLQCEPDAPERFEVDPPLGSHKDMTLLNDVTTFLRPRGDSSLPKLPLAVACFNAEEGLCRPERQADGAVVVRHPRTDHVRIENITLNEFDFEFGAGTAKANPDRSCGPTTCDEDLVKLWLDTPMGGILFDKIDYRDYDPDGEVGLGATLSKRRPPAVDADRFFLVLDTTFPPDGEEDASEGTIYCSGLTIDVTISDSPDPPQLECDDVHRLHESGGSWVD